MSFSRPFQWYQSHADPIWPDGIIFALNTIFDFATLYNSFFPPYYLAGHRDAGRRGGERLVAAVVLEPDDGNDHEAGEQEGQRDPGQDTEKGGELQRHRRLRVWKKLRELESRKTCWSRKETKFVGRSGGSESVKRGENQSLEKGIATSRIQTMPVRIPREGDELQRPRRLRVWKKGKEKSESKARIFKLLSNPGIDSKVHQFNQPMKPGGPVWQSYDYLVPSSTDCLKFQHRKMCWKARRRGHLSTRRSRLRDSESGKMERKIRARKMCWIRKETKLLGRSRDSETKKKGGGQSVFRKRDRNQ